MPNKQDKKTSKNSKSNLGKYLKQGGPGRPKGSKNHDGLGVVLDMLKDLVSRKDNLLKMKKALQKSLDNNPTHFYYKYVMPLYPKNIDVKGDGSQITYVILNDFVPTNPKSTKKGKDA